MRAFLLLAPLLLSLVACGGPRRGERPATETMVIEYNRAGLVDVELRDRMLVIVRKTSDGVSSDPTRVGESTGGYRSQRRHARMHRAQMAAFADWIEDHDVFALESRYGAGRPGSYGAGLQSRLQVRYDGRTHTVTWNDASDDDAVAAAARELVAIAERSLDEVKGN